MLNLSFLNDKKITLSVIIGIFAAFFLLNSSFLPLIDEISPFTSESRRIYKIAREYQKQGNYKEAVINYVKIPSVYRAYDAVLYQMAKSATANGDEKTTVESLKKLIKKYPDSHFAPIASYNLGQAYIRLKQNEKAEKVFSETIKKYPDTNYAKGSLYYLGQISLNSNKEKTAKYWVKYLKETPDGRFSPEILNNTDIFIKKLSSDEKLIFGKALISNHKFQKAIEILKQIPASTSWYYLAKAHSLIGDNSTALFFLKEGFTKYSNYENENNLHKAMSLFVSLNPDSELNNWSFLALNSKKALDYALYKKASLVSKENSYNIYNKIYQNYPNGDYASDSLWRIFWENFKAGNYEKAISLGQKHYLKYKNTSAAPQILFWMAKSYEKTNKPSKAKHYYKKLLELYPDSYYAFRANGRINYIENGKDTGWDLKSELISNIKSPNSLPYPQKELKTNFGISLTELILAEDTETIEMLTDDKFIQSWIKQKRGQFSKSIVMARDEMDNLMPKPSNNDERWKLLYPLNFSKLVNQYSYLNNIDPYIAISLMREESYFNTIAVSSSNARGLMQLLPTTANDVARWNNLPPVSDFQLFDPDTNIKLGTAYIKHTKSTLWGKNMFAVAAYNCGPGAVQRWVNNRNIRDYDEFVENIPYSETRNYVKKVFRSYWNYKRIYG